MESIGGPSFAVVKEKLGTHEDGNASKMLIFCWMEQMLKLALEHRIQWNQLVFSPLQSLEKALEELEIGNASWMLIFCWMRH
jgi:hypothetical protein